MIAEIVNRTIINNCSIDEYSVFNINNSTSGFVGGLIGYIRHYDFTDSYNVTITNSNNNGSISGNYAGGLIGYAYSTTTIINSYNNGSVSGGCAGGLIGEVFAAITTINNSYNNGSVSGCSTGGFVGYVGASTITITNSYNKGSISTDTSYSCYVYAGGLIGYTYYSSIITITDSYNAGSVNASASNDYAYSGGLIGYSRDDFLVISNSFNSGKINATTQGNYAYTGSLNGSSGWSPDVTNSYSLNSGNDSENGALCTINQLNSREFYTETLGWSEDVWDFSDLDVENGKYPKLK